MSIEIKRLSKNDQQDLGAALDCFSVAFDDPENYDKQRPSSEYFQNLLLRESFITLVAKHKGQVIGALAAYELPKFEQERSEIYIYDLAVDESFRQQGIATAMIDYLKPIARQCGAWVIYVQADHGDDPAINLYSKLGVREDVLHFDIPID